MTKDNNLSKDNNLPKDNNNLTFNSFLKPLDVSLYKSSSSNVSQTRIEKLNKIVFTRKIKGHSYSHMYCKNCNAGEIVCTTKNSDKHRYYSCKCGISLSKTCYLCPSSSTPSSNPDEYFTDGALDRHKRAHGFAFRNASSKSTFDNSIIKMINFHSETSNQYVPELKKKVYTYKTPDQPSGYYHMYCSHCDAGLIRSSVGLNNVFVGCINNHKLSISFSKKEAPPKDKLFYHFDIKM